MPDLNDDGGKDPHERDAKLIADTLAGLRATPKRLSPRWLYDERGSSLFERICELPEYYLTRAELEIMQAHAPAMAAAVGGTGTALIELGSGTSAKTRLLLDQLQPPAVYVPVDIARTHLERAAAELARDYPAIEIAPVCADFTQPFELPSAAAQMARRTLYFPGSTIGNFERDGACELLRTMRDMAGTSADAAGRILIGVDLIKARATLEAAYDDDAGVTAAFNHNALRHLNHALGADFDLDAFVHRAVWVDAESRIEMHLVSRRAQQVRVAGETFSFASGEHIRTESCHKYSQAGFAALAAAAGLGVESIWTDIEQRFSVQLLISR